MVTAVTTKRKKTGGRFSTQHFCGQKSHEGPSRFYIRFFFLLNLLIQSYRILSDWWLSHPSEKYESQLG